MQLVSFQETKLNCVAVVLKLLLPVQSKINISVLFFLDFVCKNKRDKYIPNRSLVAFRHRVPAATLVLECESPIWFELRGQFQQCENRCLKSGTNAWIYCPKEGLLNYLMPESPHGKELLKLYQPWEKGSVKAYPSLHVSQPTVRGSPKKLKGINSYSNRPMLVLKL